MKSNHKPCCDFCKYSDPCEVDKKGYVSNEYVMCHVKNEKVWIGGGCKEYFVCKCCSD